MSENKNPFVSLGELSKPATVLIEKVSEAVVGICKPWQMIRVAKAEAEVEQIRAASQIQVTDTHRRALRRFLEEEATRQLNMEEVTQKALPLLASESRPQDVDDDWVVNFFERCRVVSDDDMQRLWSRVLAGEANSPGAFSKRTVNLLGDLEKDDAELLTRLCGYDWDIASHQKNPLVYDFRHEIYVRNGIDFMSMEHLDSLGLCHTTRLTPYNRLKVPAKTTATYFGSTLEITLPPAVSTLDVGMVVLTRSGKELAGICEPKPVDGFIDYICNHWERYHLQPKTKADISRA